MKKAFLVGFGLWWSIGTAMADVTEIFIQSLTGKCTLAETVKLAHEYTDWMASHDVVGHYFQFDLHASRPFDLAYVSRAANAETLLKADAAFNAASAQECSAEAKLVARVTECVHFHTHSLSRVVVPPMTFKPGYFQVRFIEPKCTLTKISALTQRFEQMFEVNVELRAPMDGNASQARIAAVAQWKDAVAYGRAWDKWNAGEGKALQALQAELAACGTTVDGATLSTLF